MKNFSKISRFWLYIAAFLAAFTMIGPVVAQTWIQQNPGADPTYGVPAPRQGHIAVYNPGNNRMMVFGGELNFGGSHILSNEVWVLTHADGSDGAPAWVKLNPSPDPMYGLPSPRGHTSGVYDKASNRMIVYGGDPNVGSCYGAVNDTWILINADGSGGTPQWLKAVTSGGPPDIRQSPSVTYDEYDNLLFVFGGMTNACGTVTNDVWFLSAASGTPVWTRLNTTLPSPTPRGGNSIVFDQIATRLITFSGYEGTCLDNDAWVLSEGLSGTGVWTKLLPNGPLPPPRASHTAIYDASSNRMIVFGGGYCTPPNNDVWVLDKANGLEGTPTWLQLNPTGSRPLPRGMHSAAYNPASKRMIVFGGATTDGLTNDAWVLTDANGISEVTVTIDIHPGSLVNPINLKSSGRIPVAILKTQTFDPVNVDPATVRFGHSGTEAAPAQFSMEDVNGDGRIDMILHFETRVTGIQCADTSAMLTGKTLGGQTIKGTDSIRTNGCR